MTSSQSAGILGLGIIGDIWARHLEAAGLLRAAWNRSPKPSFPHWVATPAAAAEAADTLIIVVAGPPAVEQVIRAMEERIGPRHLVIQSSTIDPASSRRFAERVRGRGAAYLEAPFTGSKPAAERCQTVFYLGGDLETIARAEPVLSHLSQQRYTVGTGEQAATLKLACNLQIAVQMEVLCEALNWVRRSGISDERFFEILRTNASWSGLYTLKETKLRSADFAPQFSIQHLLKDLRLALAAAPTPLPLGEAVTERLKTTGDCGFAQEDICALLKSLPDQ